MSRSLHALIPAFLALAAFASPAGAQGGGFTAGDLYVTGYQGGSPAHGLVRVDPLSGDSALLGKYTGMSSYESLAFDPYRQRLVVMARLNPADGILWRPYLVDASGTFAPLEPPVASWNGLSPTGDGRIYFRAFYTDVTPFMWLDAANQLHVLYDTDGVTPFLGDGHYGVLEDMIYVASENALITVTDWSATPCPGGNASRLHVRKLPLSADGTRLSGPMSCGEFDMDTLDGEISAGLSLMPDGDLLLGAHSGHYGIPQLPRLVRVDPSTLAMAPFAYFGDASNGGSTWSTALGRGVAQSHFSGQLLAYASGQIDDGAAVPSSMSFVDTWYALEEIPALACDGGWIAYATGLKGTGNLVPRLYGEGCPEPGDLFDLHIDQVKANASGVLWTALSSAAVPFKGGTLLVSPILLQTPVAVGAGGSTTLPAFLPNDPGLTGLSVFLQAAFSDSAAIQKVSLTQGLEMEIG